MLSAVILSAGRQCALNYRQEVRIGGDLRWPPMPRKRASARKAEAVLFGTTVHLEEEPPADRKAQARPMHFRPTNVYISFDSCRSANDLAAICGARPDGNLHGSSKSGSVVAECQRVSPAGCRAGSALPQQLELRVPDQPQVQSFLPQNHGLVVLACADRRSHSWSMSS